MAPLHPLRIVRPHGRGPVRLRPNDRGIAALPPRCTDGSDGKLDSRLARAYVRTRSANGTCGRTCQYRLNVAGGGRGFNSSKRGRPVTASILIRRFFLGPKTFELFSGIQIIKRRTYFSRKSMLSDHSTAASDHLFSHRHGRPLSEKMSRNSLGGRGTS
jgi:hypothetical protein